MRLSIHWGVPVVVAGLFSTAALVGVGDFVSFEPSCGLFRITLFVGVADFVSWEDTVVTVTLSLFPGVAFFLRRTTADHSD
jgi:hypothetical protein